MKKVLSLILAAVFVFALACSFSSCNLMKPKTPSERFIEARDNIGAEVRVGPLDRKYEIDDVNYADLTFDVEAPQIIGDEKISFTVEGGFDSDAGDMSAEIGAKYKSSEIEVKAEIANREILYISFPGITDKFLWGGPEVFAEMAEDSAGSLLGIGDIIPIDSLSNGNESTVKKVENLIDEIVDEYVTDESVVVETEDVEVLGSTVKGADKLSVSLNAEQLKEVEDKIADTLGDIYDFEDVGFGDDAAATMSLWVSRDSTVRAELTVTNASSEVKAVYEMRSENGKVEANLDYTVTEDGSVTTMIPLRYEHEEKNGKYEGSFRIDGEKLVLSEDSDYDFDANSAAFDFEGTASSGSADFTYTVRIGAGSTVVKVPVNVKISNAGPNADNVEISVEYQQIATLKASGVVSHGDIRISEYDLTKGIGFNEDMSEEDAAEIREIAEKIAGELGDFTELIGNVFSTFSGGNADG